MPGEKAKAKTEKKPDALTQFILQRKSYILGVFIGICLLSLNTYVGLYITRLILDDKTPPVVDGVSLPAINTQDYLTVRMDQDRREQKQLKLPPTNDPFKTSK